ncbi:MAG: cupin domain-containing protein [Actinophytocola sp.]|uniref:cupin domain-containing protein n=1 Tax=Actinophytocola sp. TaxID=1872138 RepID=UPI0013278CB7|nr:cupin domain-containing protein [Actinophytocola sp.]MPZ81924.1 cupin domain-containing protein [Actinophytocola sp.]
MNDATYRLSPQQTLTVRRSSADTGGELLEVEATWAGGGPLPPAHFHPAQDEHFEVVDGQLRVLLDGEERLLGPGDVLDIPRGTVHAMTATHDGARAIWQTRPAMHTERFFAAMDAAHNRGGSLLDLVPVARTHAAEVRFTNPPPWIQGPLFAVLSLTARLLRR